MRFGGCVAWVLCVAALTPGAATAQQETIDKGSVLVGGTAGISSHREDGDDVSRVSISFSPTVGVFLVRGLAVSGALSFGYASDRFTSLTSWGIGPGVTYYFARIMGRAYPFVRMQASFARSSSHASSALRGTTVNVDATTNAVEVRPGAGLVLMLIPHVGVQGELYLSRSWTTFDTEGTNLTPSLGDVNATAYGFSAGVAAFVF